MRILILLAGASLFMTGATGLGQAITPSVSFTAHPIDTGLTGGYQVVIADLNRDGKPDIIALASGLKDLCWYENPTWKKHVLVSGVNAMINVAAYDIDGDGIPELALAHEFSTTYKSSLGIVSLLTHGADPTAPWTMKEIDRVPTSHRLRWVDAEGNGKKVLVNFPLIGANSTAPEYRDHVSLFWYRPGTWTRQVITDAEEGVVHGAVPTLWDNSTREAVLSASFLGVHLLQFDKEQWKRTPLVKGDPGPWPKSGTSDVVVGHVGRERFLATIEPWHGNEIVIYRQSNDEWTRRVIDDTISDGHTIVAADFDGDGQDELVVGERGGKHSAYIFRVTDARANTWSKQPLDDGGMAAAGCAVADLNADRRPDVVCIGTATANLKWYENTTVRRGRP